MLGITVITHTTAGTGSQWPHGCARSGSPAGLARSRNPRTPLPSLSAEASDRALNLDTTTVAAVLQHTNPSRRSTSMVKCQHKQQQMPRNSSCSPVTWQVVPSTWTTVNSFCLSLIALYSPQPVSQCLFSFTSVMY